MNRNLQNEMSMKFNNRERHAVQIGHLACACIPRQLRHERILRLHPAVEHQIFVFSLPGGHTAGVFGHRSHFLFVHEDMQRRIGRFDGIK
jgi:hypothetical protein